MITIYSEDHKRHHGKHEFSLGKLIPPFENPMRLDSILASLTKAKSTEIITPREYGLDPILRVHTEEFVNFLKSAYDDWHSIYGKIDALPTVWPTRLLRQVIPEDILGKLGYYSFDCVTPITEGTWQAITSSVNVALTGVSLIGEGRRSAFSLCRPPGHHASTDVYGGFCFFNNAAITAQAFIDGGAKRVTILDVDYHHGNGTQSIFYDRPDVQYVSLHADPSQDYPYYLGHANETGNGEGEGFNSNFPMRWGTVWSHYKNILNQALCNIRSFAPEILVLSLGVDTFENDPISQFKLKTENYIEMGKMIGQLDLPTLFIMEGGYAVDEIGLNVSNVLSGFEAVQ